MEEKAVLKDLFEIKHRVEQMDLLEFKSQWEQQTSDHAHLAYTDRLKFTVMSIKILQAKVDLIRTITSVRELAQHQEPERAIYHYLRSNLWRFLDNFRYILLVDDVSDQVKLECMDLLDELTEIIAQDDQLKASSVSRLQKLLAQIKLLENTTSLQQHGLSLRPIHTQLDQRVSHLLEILDPKPQEKETPPPVDLPIKLRKLLDLYASFSVSRISIEKSGVTSIIQLLYAHPEEQLTQHRDQLAETFMRLERQGLLNPAIKPVRNQCAYALVILSEMLKMHKGLPVLLLKILKLCALVYFPPPGVNIEQELQGLKARISDISQKRLRPIVEDVLWKNAEYFARLPHLHRVCAWCYTASSVNTPDVSYAQRIVASSFDRLFIAEQSAAGFLDTSTSLLSKTIIEILGLLVNLEPSPNFLKLHARDTLQIKHAKDGTLPTEPIDQLYEQQYTTYKQHLKFLQESLEYYQGILEHLRNG